MDFRFGALLILLPVVLCLNTREYSEYLNGFNLHQAPPPVVFDDSVGLGRKFEGIGAISGGGATSKLLVNYEKKLRDEILDYLFKPNFGASLQIFKVEIGGDVQSTDGTEASHMHNSWDENYSRGYEWWLMQEAKKRNPNIKLYSLPWGFPGWIGQGKLSPYANVNVTADYIVRWINGAKKVYNLTIDYVGIWNERPYDKTYIKTLRSMLDARGFSKTLIIAADEAWEIATDIEKDPSLAATIHAIGCHYPGTKSSIDAQRTGKSLWASEDYSTYNNEVGGGCWARILNQNYVNGLITSTISWNLIGSYYPDLPFYSDGLMTAVQPWSGYYIVATPIWMTAHTTQFVPVGWRYLSHGNGVGKLPKGGSYVSLTNDAKDQLTIIIETMTHDHSKCIRPGLPAYDVSAQNITITLKGSFAPVSQLNVWYSKLGFNGSANQMFQKQKPLVLKNGQAKLTLGLDEIVTLTTLTTGNKGSHPTPPGPKPYPLPYSDNFEALQVAQEPLNLAPQVGSFEVVQSQNASHNHVCRQTVLHPPIKWCPLTLSTPIAVIGQYSWDNITVTVEFEIPSVNGTNGVFVAARVDQGGCNVFAAHGIFFFVFAKDGQFIVTNDLLRTKVLTQGYVLFNPGWHNISLTVSGNEAVGVFDGVEYFTLKVPDHPANGWAAIGTDSFGLADFDNLSIKSAESISKVQFLQDDSESLYFESEINP
ncbi:galactocerebrosidase [Plakobranchus ocellatus]|uniref:galactosylceramidase n=1 Tax=Plakobranchus ocellatus TaxID=259542 RepID=A0AAV4BIK3_9GAST|nr:galactocerebrosidase [Plakobranchus ocellatus]